MRSCRLRNFRLIWPYQNVDDIYDVDQMLEQREELLWDGTRMYGVVIYSFAKPTNPTIVACEIEEKFRIQQRDTEQRTS